MVRINLTDGFVNKIMKRFAQKYIAKRLGATTKLDIHTLTLDERDGRVSLKIDVDVDMAKDEVLRLVEKMYE